MPTIGNNPSAGMPTPRTDEALRLPQPVQVVQTVSIGREPGLELPNRPRVVQTRTRLKRIHAISLVRSDEYPQRRLCRRLRYADLNTKALVKGGDRPRKIGIIRRLWSCSPRSFREKEENDGQTG